jgi:L,D-transpeptidase YcbB
VERERSHPGTIARQRMIARLGTRDLEPDDIDWAAPPQGVLLVQRPGTHNALGPIRFGHASPAFGAYYVHGTPDARVFSRGSAGRRVSSGCVRLADPVELATLLLRASPEALTAERLRAEIARHDGGMRPGRSIPLPTRVGLVMTYLSAWATPEGIVIDRDVYDRDGA